MTTWIALFRGINVGGRHRLPMQDLVAALEVTGCTCIRTYIQSGNAVFSKSGSKAPDLARRIGEIIFERHGFEPEVILLTVGELADALRSNPFPAAEADPKSLHLLFLATEPTSPEIDSLDAIKADSERYMLKGRTFYFHAPDGIGRSKLAARAEKLLGVSATARNWRTVSKLLELARLNDSGTALPER